MVKRCHTSQCPPPLLTNARRFFLHVSAIRFESIGLEAAIQLMIYNNSNLQYQNAILYKFLSTQKMSLAFAVYKVCISYLFYRIGLWDLCNMHHGAGRRCAGCQPCPGWRSQWWFFLSRFPQRFQSRAALFVVSCLNYTGWIHVISVYTYISLDLYFKWG